MGQYLLSTWSLTNPERNVNVLNFLLPPGWSAWSTHSLSPSSLPLPLTCLLLSVAGSCGQPLPRLACKRRPAKCLIKILSTCDFCRTLSVFPLLFITFSQFFLQFPIELSLSICRVKFLAPLTLWLIHFVALLSNSPKVVLTIERIDWSGRVWTVYVDNRTRRRSGRVTMTKNTDNYTRDQHRQNQWARMNHLQATIVTDPVPVNVLIRCEYTSAER